MINIWVLLPAFNEAQNIGPLLTEIRSKGLKTIVIDDGSEDGTIEAALASDLVIKNEANLGKGASLRKALDHIIAAHLACDAVIIMDADGQHLTDELPGFVQALKKGEVLVVGNRMDNPTGMPWLRRLTNRLMSRLISRLCGQLIPDSQCGFKAIHLNVIRSINISSSRYEIDSELILKSAAAGFRISSIPISSVYSDKKSGIHPFRDTLRFIRFIVNWRKTH